MADQIAQSPATWVVSTMVLGYLIGSIPFAYIIVRAVTGEDVTQHGSGNVGAMNVRRSTGSWSWFSLAMLADGFKGLIPVLVAKGFATGFEAGWVALPVGVIATSSLALALLPQATLAGCVLGHNYSIWMGFIKKSFGRTGKGLATGGGALLAYDWRYFVIVVVVGLTVIALSRYMMAGQVAAAASLPIGALALGSPDWGFAFLMGALVYAAHHKRFVGMLRGQEPKLYVNDRMGPRG